MNYDEALTYLYDHANLEKMKFPQPGDADLGLERIRKLMGHFGNPQNSLKVVLIAGTKGKGSTAAMAESILRKAGYKTGLYTQPHLHSYRERFRVSSLPVTGDRFAGLVERVKKVVEQEGLDDVTTYEIATAVMFLYFFEEKVDIAIVEVGLGGRLDSTNIVTPLVSVITSISMDHMQLLGNTLEEIASEKAGIIKPNGTVLVAPQRPSALEVIEKRAAELGARVVLVGREVRFAGVSRPGDERGGQWVRVFFQRGFCVNQGIPADLEAWIPLEGQHQQINATVALAIVDLLGHNGFAVWEKDAIAGLALVEWPGRLELVAQNPPIYVDGAHNADSAEKLALALRKDIGYKHLILIVGTSSDKDIPGILSNLVPHAAEVILTRSGHPRAADPDYLAEEARKYSQNVRTAATVRDAVDEAKKIAREGDVVCITGSLFIVAEAREVFGLAREVDKVQL